MPDCWFRAPAREFSPAEFAAIKSFVAGGGTFVCMVGAEDARASAPLLAEFDFRVPPSPVPPGHSSREPEPFGAKLSQMTKDSREYRFYAAWPVECQLAEDKQTRWSVWTDGNNELPVIVSQSEQHGTVVVIGDTHFACNENYEMGKEGLNEFWHWLLGRAVVGQKAWDPPPAPPETNPPEHKEESPADMIKALE